MLSQQFDDEGIRSTGSRGEVDLDPSFAAPGGSIAWTPGRIENDHDLSGIVAQRTRQQTEQRITGFLQALRSRALIHQTHVME
jgi:hypothetical protein